MDSKPIIRYITVKEAIGKYTDYINEHINNVKRAFNELESTLDKLNEEKILNFDKDELVRNIKDHDHSKFSDYEFNGYRQWFYPVNGADRYKNLYDKAWNHHTEVNPHHPEHWVVHDPMKNNNVVTIMEMPDVYLAELICDWQAMSYKFNNNPLEYYKKEGYKLPFSPETKLKLVNILNYIYSKKENKNG